MRRALLTALVLWATGARADASSTGVLSVRLVELRSNSGRIGCALFSTERGFPKDRSAAAQTKWCPIANRESTCSFDPTPAGTYAVACFHDENNNGRMDTGEPPPLPWTVFYAASRLDFNINSNSIGLT
jgi:uncharacterized protein (DUF2141 family)